MRRTRQNAKQAGFILILTFFILSAAMVLITYLLTRVMSSQPVSAFVLERERDKQLAIGGIELIKSKLEHRDDNELKESLEWLFMVINRWTEIPLKQERDGTTATLLFYISAEDGKINLNRFFDATKKEFKLSANPANKKLLATISDAVRKQFPNDFSLMDEIEKSLKKRKKPLEDLSELFVDPVNPSNPSDPSVAALAQAPMSYFPTLPVKEKGSKKPDTGKTDVEKRSFALSDLFTVISDEPAKINPLYLSYWSTMVCGLKPWTEVNDDREKLVKNLVRNIASKYLTKLVWSKDWDALLAQVYGKKYPAIDQSISSLFEGAGGAKTLSVLCYGKTGERSQGVCALLQREIGANKRVFYVIKRWYWI